MKRNESPLRPRLAVSAASMARVSKKSRNAAFLLPNHQPKFTLFCLSLSFLSLIRSLNISFTPTSSSKERKKNP